MVLILKQALCGMQGGDFGEGGKINVLVNGGFLVVQ